MGHLRRGRDARNRRRRRAALGNLLRGIATAACFRASECRHIDASADVHVADRPHPEKRPSGDTGASA